MTRVPLLGSLLALFVAAVPVSSQVAVRQPVLIQRRVAPAVATPATETVLTDAKALEAAGLKADDGATLLTYIRQRTLSDAELSKIQAVIKRLGADDFDDRLKAAVEVERFGPAAVVPLRTAAESDPDPEIAYRASESLARLEKVPHAQVALAAVKALAKIRPSETSAVLLAFLPRADNDQVVAAIRETLTVVALRDGKPDPELVKALKDASPILRTAAAIALVEGGPTDRLVRIPESFPQVLEAVSAEKDPETKFQMLFPIVVTAREKDTITQMIDLLPDLHRGRMWQVEDYLFQLAGENAPKAVLGKSKESLIAARDAWRKWWDGASKTTDVAKFAYAPRISGRTLLTLMDYRYGNAGMVVELGPDMKELWKIQGLNSPIDAVLLPNGNIAVAEQNSNRITIRDKQGNIVASKNIGGANRVYGNPQQIQMLENGNMLVGCRNVVVEFKKDTEEVVWSYVRNQQYDITATRRLATGETLLLLQQGAPNFCMFIDKNGKEIADRALKVQMPAYQGFIAELPDSKILITEQQRIVEYDVKTGKSGWTKSATQPRSIQRLPNGNTLYVESVPGNNSNRIVEVTPTGEEVWSYQPTGIHQVLRAYRR